MRYREEDPAPNPDYPYSQDMHAMLSVSVVLSLMIGILLLYLGRRGKVMWLRWWSGGLIACSVVYLGLDAIGIA